MNGYTVHTADVTLAERIRSAVNAELAQRGISQRELARRLGWSQQYAWRRLAGRQEMSPSDLEQISQELGVSITDLVSRPVEVS